MEYILTKYHGKWAVYSRTTGCYNYIGMGKAFCERKAKELNMEDR